MKAVDRLRALENLREAPEPEPPKPPIPGFGGFVSANREASQNFASANDGTARPVATSEQAAELRELLARIADGWTDDDREEALRVALADPAGALTSFRALVADMEPDRYARTRTHEADTESGSLLGSEGEAPGPNLSGQRSPFRMAIPSGGEAPGPYLSAPSHFLLGRNGDDRRACRDCANLSPIGRCLAAARGNRGTDAGRSGFPIDDLLRRCAGFAPGADDSDRRPGAERWPGMVEDAERVRALARQTT